MEWIPMPVHEYAAAGVADGSQVEAVPGDRGVRRAKYSGQKR